MAVDIVMPQMGESIFEGTITRWLKKPGDNVERDEPLFEISTDKVDAEIPSPIAGVLTEIRHKEGETVPVNSVVAVIGQGGARAETTAATAAPRVHAAAPPPARPRGGGRPGQTRAGRSPRTGGTAAAKAVGGARGPDGADVGDAQEDRRAHDREPAHLGSRALGVRDQLSPRRADPRGQEGRVRACRGE